MDQLMSMICKDLNGAVPDEIQVIPFGSHTTSKGDFVSDAQSQALVIAEYEVRQNDMVIDYEHQTLLDVQAPAAGWVKGRIGLEDRGEAGIWAKVDWTDKAREYIANREYRYVSPVFSVRKSDNRVVALLNVALTNQPNIDGMVPIVNKRNLNQEEVMLRKQICNKLGCPETCTDEELLTTLDNKMGDGGKGKEMACKLLTDLGLAEDATTENAVKAIATLKDQASVMASKDVRSALGLSDTSSVGEATAVILAMKQGDSNGMVLAGKVATLETQLKKRDADEVVELAMKEGKVTPAQREWADKYAASDLEGFRTFASKAPVVIPVGTLTTDTVNPGNQDAVTIANKATVYRAEQAGKGIQVSATEAVAYITKGGK
jgi:phage I-like protein